jgi:hypothetical protein
MMITLRQIQRMVDAGRFQPLVARVLENGRCPLDDVQTYLGAAAPALAGLGLALQRVLELTDRVDGPAGAIASRLCGCMEQAIRQQTLDTADPAGLAVAAAALDDWLKCAASHQSTHHEQARITVLRDSCLDMLGRRVDEDGDDEQSELAWMIVTWQLLPRGCGDAHLRTHLRDRLFAPVPHDDGPFNRFVHAVAA